mgnify:CR=1 FL=1
MEHRFLRNYDQAGTWTKSTRIICVKGVEFDLDEYAELHGIELPDRPSNKPKDIQKEVNTNADMGRQDDSGDHQIDGDGSSEGSE